MTINIMSAKIEDFKTINSIVKEGQDEHSEALPHIFQKVEQVMPDNYFLQLLENPDCEILVAQLKGNVVGFAVMELKESPSFESMTPRKYAYMNDFGVKNNYQREGIGSALFQACVDWSKINSAASLELNVWEFNHKAISFYESFGMSTVSRKMNLDF
ncbi:GNAT family N-acetyltransferase [Psychrobacillus sp. OK032]|uniref:GNAT family N-acetyltransferase n=1 Tax=Psychrobacillus sp. OK032 TaxID=1884358 RepID=UPI0008D48C12|nr:GNAT family N-acetyltransferase [Psychrobacillus sp. OK032]SES46307.1 Acetyltransferase (GNAT) family protein [Psychrobacillus sp. OK032]